MVAEHIPHFVQVLEPIVTHYGYFAVGGLLFVEDFGIPVPGETTLITAAIFAGLGNLNIFVVIITALLACFIGDNTGYLIGRYGGYPLIERYGKYVFLTPQRFASAESFFSRNGHKVVFIARFINGLREANGIIAGVTRMKWRQFAVYNFAGALLWVVTWSSIGYIGGNHIEAFIRYQLHFTVFSLFAVVGYSSYRYYKKRAHQNVTN